MKEILECSMRITVLGTEKENRGTLKQWISRDYEIAGEFRS
jgi:hypothetical protein